MERSWFKNGSNRHLLEEMRQNEISTVVDDMPVYEGMEILVADAKTRVVKGATDNSRTGATLEELNLLSDQDHYDETAVFHVRIGKKSYRCLLCQDENYIVAVTVDNSFYLQSSLLAIFIVGIYLTLASCCMVYMLSRVLKEKYEKEKLIYTSNTDELTKCLNRHAYKEAINNLKLHDEWGYISMDLNGLKRANDSLGHAAGDELLCAAADCMRECFKAHGKVYRIGGDEFVIILTQEVTSLPDRLEAFDKRVASWHGKLVDTMTISHGYALSSEKSWDSIHDLAKAADARMYENKARYYRESGMDRRR